MKKYILTGFLIAAVFIQSAKAEDTVSGSLTVNGKPVELKHVYTDSGPDDVIVVMTDAPLSEADIPFGVAMLAMDGKVRGIVIKIKKKSSSIAPRGYNAIFHDVWEGQLGTIGNGVLTIDKMNDEVIEGALKTPEPNTWTNAIEDRDDVYSYDVKFKARVVKREL